MPASNQSECDANADGAFIDPTQLTILDKLTVAKKSDLARKRMIEKPKSTSSDKKKKKNNERLVHVLTPIPRLSLLLPV